jgi:hypothetical protein
MALDLDSLRSECAAAATESFQSALGRVNDWYRSIARRGDLARMLPFMRAARRNPGSLLAWIGAIAVLTLGASSGCNASDPPTRPTGSPADDLPPHIVRLTESGMRPDWSADGTRLLFLDALVGDVFEIELESRRVRPLTKHYPHGGYSRARYLANGDVLLCGPGAAAKGKPEGGRWHAELWFLNARLDHPAVALGEPCFEGPAVSRRSLRIAWTRSDYPDRIVFGRSEIWTGEIALEGGSAQLVNRRKLLDRSDFHYLAFLETQDFRPPEERELIFTAYAYRGGEVMGVDLETGELRNYSRSWGYDEAEGVFPDGRFVAVEREPGTYTLTPRGPIDIWRTALDETTTSVRLTYFSDHPGFGANNPVVRPDGKVMAFQLRWADGPHGNGHGIFLYDLERGPGTTTTGP